MQQDYERVLAFEKQAVGNELKAESWQRFLKNWKEDNPYSQQDTELRSGAQAKLSYWRNVQKVEPTCGEPTYIKPTIQALSSAILLCLTAPSTTVTASYRSRALPPKEAGFR